MFRLGASDHMETGIVTWGCCQRYFFRNSANVMSANWFKPTEKEEGVKNSQRHRKVSISRDLGGISIGFLESKSH